jgi:hypothetical protein
MHAIPGTPLFTEKISYFALGIDRELMVVRAACHAVQVALDNEQLIFPLTAVNGSVSRRVMLANNGDIGTKFAFSTTSEMRKWFSITPEKGYVSPSAEMAIVVTFHPKQVRACVCVRVRACACVCACVRVCVPAYALATITRSCPLEFTALTRTTHHCPGTVRQARDYVFGVSARLSPSSSCR